MNNIEYFYSGILLGFSTGLYCLATCGIVFAAYLGVSGHSETKLKIINFFTGRFVIYSITGISAGFFANSITKLINPNTKYFFIITGIYLIYISLRDVDKKKCFAAKTKNAFLLGLVTGVQPCAPFIAGVTAAAASGGIIPAFLIFFAFFMTSSIMMLPALIPAFFSRIKIIKSFARFCLITAGVWFLYSGLIGIFPVKKNEIGNIDERYNSINKTLQKRFKISFENKVYKLFDYNNDYNSIIPVMVFINKSNIIESIEILPNKETSYNLDILKLNNFAANFINKPITYNFDFYKNIDGYSGATITAKAITDGITKSIKKIFVGKQKSFVTAENKNEIYFVIAGIIFSCAAIIFKKKCLYYLSILYSLIILAYIKKIILSINTLLFLLNGNSVFLIMTPLLILFLFSFIMLFFKGRIYCFFFCPFGIITDIIRKLLKKTGLPLLHSDIIIFYYAKFILLILYIFYFIPISETYSYEPFNFILNFAFNGFYSLLSILLLIYSIFDFKFYCRYLCMLNALFISLKKIMVKL